MTALIQARGALVVFRSEEGPAVAASVNSADFLGSDPMGRVPEAVLGGEALHAVRNAVSLPWAATEPVFAGRHQVGDRLMDLDVHQSGGRLVVEVQPSGREAVPDGYEVERDVRVLAERIAADGGTQGLRDLLRTLSGYSDTALEPPPEGLSNPFVLEDSVRDPVEMEGEVVDLGVAGLRQPAAEVLAMLERAGVRALAVIGPFVLKHSRPRVPSRRTWLVLRHMAMLQAK
jgi:hypothetical protein